MGMLSAEDLAMSAQELSGRIPGPGSYWYNVYAREAPELLAEAEAIRKSAAEEARGYVPTAEDNAQLAALSGGERRQQELINRGVIDKAGNILKPGGINPTEFMRGEAPSWASPELIRQSYLQAFQSKAAGGQDFMESGDYQNFLKAGYTLPDGFATATSPASNPSSGGLTFGGASSQPVSTPQPASPSQPVGAPPTWGQGEIAVRDPYKAQGATPFMDSYLRSREAAQKKGPVSSMFADMIPKE